MSRVLVTTDYLGPGDDIDDLLRRHGHEVTYAPARRARNRAEALALFDGIDGAVVASEPITADMLETATSLKVIARSGVGYDSVDLVAAARHGVGCATPRRQPRRGRRNDDHPDPDDRPRTPHILAGVRAGRWPRDAGRELRGSTLGIIGYGPSGRAVAQLGLAFGMSVAVHSAHPTGDPGIEFVDLDTVTATADYLSLHTRAAAQAEHLIDRKRLQAMKNTAVLINTARGSLVDEDALADALEAGDIAGAALDVVAREPLPADSRLRGLDNVLITSHLAGQTVEARNRAGLAAAQAVIDVLAGREPAHPVDKETV